MTSVTPVCTLADLIPYAVTLQALLRWCLHFGLR